jgi:uncharacterized protein (DUF305 family)
MGVVRFTILLVFASSVAVPASSPSHSPASVGGPAWAAYAGSMEEMHTSMAAVKPTGDSDVDFVRLMLPHHQAAIDMAKAQLVYGKDPQMRRLAQEIITDQQSEIELMRLWLKQQGQHTLKMETEPAFKASEER